MTLIVALLAVATRFIAFPSVDEPKKSDVIFVLGPPTPTRVALGQKLAREKFATALMISVSASGPYSRDELPVCHGTFTYEVYCITPSPFSTQGEAEYLRGASSRHDWTSAIVVTYTPHVTRARILMQRCFTGRLEMVPDRQPISLLHWAYSFAYQLGAFVKVGVSESC